MEIIYDLIGNKPLWHVKGKTEIGFKTQKELLTHLNFDGPVKRVGNHTFKTKTGKDVTRPVCLLEPKKNKAETKAAEA